MMTNADPCDLVIRSDNGPKMTFRRLRKYIDQQSLTHEFIPPKSPKLNVYIESFFLVVDRELYQGKKIHGLYGSLH